MIEIPFVVIYHNKKNLTSLLLYSILTEGSILKVNTVSKASQDINMSKNLIPIKDLILSSSIPRRQPFTTTLPLSGSIKVAIIFKRVVFPAPFGPRTPSIPPFLRENETSSSARVGLLCLKSSLINLVKERGGIKSLVNFSISNICFI